MKDDIECTFRKCQCGNNHVTKLGIIDSEIYCQCISCGKFNVACDKADECNDEIYKKRKRCTKWQK